MAGRSGVCRPPQWAASPDLSRPRGRCGAVRLHRLVDLLSRRARARAAGPTPVLGSFKLPTRVIARSLCAVQYGCRGRSQLVGLRKRGKERHEGTQDMRWPCRTLALFGVGASVALADSGNGNGGNPPGPINQCGPSEHGVYDASGVFQGREQNGGGSGNCGQNQSGNGGDHGYGNGDGCIVPPPPNYDDGRTADTTTDEPTEISRRRLSCRRHDDHPRSRRSRRPRGAAARRPQDRHDDD